MENLTRTFFIIISLFILVLDITVSTEVVYGKEAKSNEENIKFNKEKEGEIYNPNLNVTSIIDEIWEYKRSRKFRISNKIFNNNIKLTVSLAGDITIGTDESYGYKNSFIEEVKKNNHNYSYFVAGVKEFFAQDDLTIANLETTLTNATEKAEKKFRFKGDPDYVEILKIGGIEVVNIANNHTFDYLEEGFMDTVDTLSEAEVGFFGYDFKYVTNIKGIKVGLLGYEGWVATEKLKERIRKDINLLKEEADLIIVSFHWGIEREYYPNEDQINLGHFTIDQGADLVFGHHPHVVQGIEEYKGKNIVYSLGNFLFGGNRNPADKDTFIFQQTFTFDQSGKLLLDNNINIIPCSISSVSWRNNYQPIPLNGKEKERVFNKINDLSSIFWNKE